jgi:hypothetical protein
MNNRPLSVRVTLVFIVLNSLIWLALGVIIAADVHPAIPDLPLYKGIMAFLSLATAGVLLVLFIFIWKHSRVAYFIALALFVVTALLIFFDDVGLPDLVVLAINIVPIFLLVKDRSWYLQRGPHVVDRI